ncbi:hypothetical protein N9A42_00190 [bacterium]|nr:hypothetical protein [bacterium]
MRYIMTLLLFVSFAAIGQESDTTPEPDPTPIEDIIVTQSTTDSTVTSNSNTTTTLKSPPPSAIAPTINTSNSDLCTFGVAGAVQTQILGISTGTQVTDDNCERLKNAKTLYDMGMKVAAVSVMCQDERVFDAMMHAGTPCPYDGLIGAEAKQGWQMAALAEEEEEKEGIIASLGENIDDETKTLIGTGGVASLLLLLLL